MLTSAHGLITKHHSSLTFSTLFLCELQALSKALTEDELLYLRAQFALLEPNRDGRVSFENFRMVGIFHYFGIIFIFLLELVFSIKRTLFSLQALTSNATDAMKESRVPDILNSVMDLLFDI